MPPWAPLRIDVSGLDQWVTLGGVAKGDTGSDALRIKSFIRLLPLYWLTKEWTGDISFNDGVSVQITTLAPSADPVQGDEFFPQQRGIDYPSNYEVKYASGANNISVGFTAEPVMMFDGSTVDAADFVGWGIWSNFQSTSGIWFGASGNGSGWSETYTEHFRSYCNESAASGHSYSESTYKVGTENVPFIKEIYDVSSGTPPGGEGITAFDVGEWSLYDLPTV